MSPERDFFIEVAAGLTVAALVGIFTISLRTFNLLKEKISQNDAKHDANDRLWSLQYSKAIRTDLLANRLMEYPAKPAWKHS